MTTKTATVKSVTVKTIKSVKSETSETEKKQMKDMRKIAEEYRLNQWSGIMRNRQESGLSIKSYCEREGIKPERYFYWQKKLRETAVAELAPAEPSLIMSVPSENESEKPTPSVWSEVIVREETKRNENAEVTIEIGKCRISANESTNVELLTKVCKALGELC